MLRVWILSTIKNLQKLQHVMNINDQQELYYAMNMSMTSKNYNMQWNIDDEE
jgi:hypothetical protein